MNHRLRVLVVDREPTRFGIRVALEREAIVCAEAADGEQAIRAAMRAQPDLCLVNWELAGEAIRGICRAAPTTAVIVLAGEPNVEDLLASVQAGAVGYVAAAVDASSLRRVVRAVAADEAVIPRKMVLELLLELRGAGGADGLTARESQVLGMVRRGHTTRQVAQRLNIAPVTVRRHISDIVEKLGVQDRSGLMHSRPRFGRQAIPSRGVQGG